MENAKNGYYFIFGIALFTGIGSLSRIAASAVILAATLLFRHADAIPAARIAGETLLFAGKALLFYLLLLRIMRGGAYAGKHPLPTPLFIVVLAAVPALFLLNLLFDLVVFFPMMRWLFDDAVLSRHFGIENAVFMIRTFLDACLLGILGIIVMARAKRTAHRGTYVQKSQSAQ